MSGTDQFTVGVMGAGLIGLYLGGALQLAGHKVTYFGRERMERALTEAGGLEIDGRRIERRELDYQLVGPSLEVADYTELDVVLVALKVGHIEGMVCPKFSKNALFVSLCNGVQAVSLLQDKLPGHDVVAGMVPYNVRMDGGYVCRTFASGPIVIENHPKTAKLDEAFLKASIPCKLSEDVTSVLWSKLVLNMNNAVHALHGGSLKKEIGQRSLRLIIAEAKREALRVCDAEGVQTVKLTPLPMSLVPLFFEMPDFVVDYVSANKISEKSSSSMYEDLSRGAPTEVDYLSGFICQRAAKHGIPVPVNTALTALIKEAETTHCSPHYSPQVLHAKIREIAGWRPSWGSTYCTVM
ncbi:putative 2-dehydropantoate 2-reductase [Diplonema papillatum]|nr:putative 2-dehydropantoate 2-reductase [Diplonema papillatum]